MGASEMTYPSESKGQIYQPEGMSEREQDELERLPRNFTRVPEERYDLNKSNEAFAEAEGNFALIERVMSFAPLKKAEVTAEFERLGDLRAEAQKYQDLQNPTEKQLEHLKQTQALIKDAETYISLHELRLVTYVIARKLQLSPLDVGSEGGISWADMFQEGYFGLLATIANYTPSKGGFAGHAIGHISQRLNRIVSDTSRNIRYPVHLDEEVSRMQKYQELELENTGRYLGENPKQDAELIHHLAEEMGIAPYRARMLIKLGNMQTSLDALNESVLSEYPDLQLLDYDSDNPSESLEEPNLDDYRSIAGDPDKSLEAIVEQMDLRVAVLDTIEELSAREKALVRLRFGLDDGNSRTLEEVGEEFGVTRERIRQIESKLLDKLRHPHRSTKLRAYLNEEEDVEKAAMLRKSRQEEYERKQRLLGETAKRNG